MFDVKKKKGSHSVTMNTFAFLRLHFHLAKLERSAVKKN